MAFEIGKDLCGLRSYLVFFRTAFPFLLAGSRTTSNRAFTGPGLVVVNTRGCAITRDYSPHNALPRSTATTSSGRQIEFQITTSSELKGHDHDDGGDQSVGRRIDYDGGSIGS